MSSKIKELFLSTSLYGIGGVSIRVIGFLLLPFYLKYLSPAEYGVVEIVNTLMTVLTIILGFGMSSAVFREYYREDNELYKKRIIGTAFIFLVISDVIIISVLLLLKTTLSRILIGVEGHDYIFSLILINVFFLATLNLTLAVVRANEKPLQFSLYNVVRTILYATVNLVLVSFFKRGYIGVVEGICFSTIATVIISSPVLFRNISLKFSLNALKRMLTFGIPIVFSGLSVWVLNLTDRYMLKFLLSPEIAYTQIGIYSLAAKLSTIGKMIIIQPFELSWGVAMFKHEKSSDATDFYAQTFKYFVIIAALFYTITVLFSENVIKLLSSNSNYCEAFEIVPFLTGSAMFSGIFIVLSVGLTLTYKNRYSSIATIVAACLNIFLNLILIPHFYIKGAAIASLVSSVIMVIMQYLFSQKFYRIKYNLKLFSLVLLTQIAIAVCSTNINLSLPLKFILFIIVSVLLLAIGNINVLRLIRRNRGTI